MDTPPRCSSAATCHTNRGELLSTIRVMICTFAAVRQMAVTAAR